MLSQVRKNITNPSGILYHHCLIKILISHQLKVKGKTWDSFVFEVMNPHLVKKPLTKTPDSRKHPWHTHNREPSQTPSIENKSLKMVHIDEDTPQASSPAPSPTSVNLVATEFILFPQVWTKNKKYKFVQITV